MQLAEVRVLTLIASYRTPARTRLAVLHVRDPDHKRARNDKQHDHLWLRNRRNCPRIDRLKSLALYCCSVSRTTAPLTGVTSRYRAASVIAASSNSAFRGARI